MHNKVLILSLYALILNAFFRPILGGAATLFGYIAIVFSLMYPLVNSSYGARIYIGKKNMVLFGVLVISFLSSISFLEFDDLMNLVISSASFFAFYWALSQEKTEKQVLFLQEITNANYILCAVLILYGYGPFAFKYSEVNIWGNKVFNMGLGNPNVVAVYVMFAMMLLLIHLVNSSRLICRIVDLVLLGMLLYLIVLLSSRTVVACLILLVIGYWISKMKSDNKLFRVIILTWPFLMILIILGLKNYGLALQVLGKALETGRSGIYNEAISEIQTTPIAYIFGQICKNRFANMHNGPLTILSNVGCVGLAICYSIWFKHLGRVYQVAQTSTQKIAMYAMYAFVIHASAESLSMIGTIPYAMMIIIVDRIALGHIVDKKDYKTSNAILIKEE